MAKLKANNRYSTKLIASFDPTEDTTISVAVLPTEFPTLVTLGYGTTQETTYKVTGSSGDNTLTGISLFKGVERAYFEGTTVDCINWAEFFNQFTNLSVSYIGTDTTDYDDFNNVYHALVSDSDFDYAQGTILYFQALQTNTGSVKLKVNDLGEMPLRKAGNTELMAGDITPNQTMMILFANDDFQLLSAISNESLEQRVSNLETGYVVNTSSDEVTFNLSQNNIHSLVLTENTTLDVENVQVGRKFVIRLTQDETGGRTVTWWDGIKWVGGAAPTLTATAEKTDTFVFICTKEDEYDGYIAGMGL